ncbi:S26 family signal peptidase [Nesterenkonia salmonea]|uniref:S26 family signal peptidase n=1 Tax=Nesterenkonia salmonea TaxID=1804987 RepID=A0A5R9B8P8_9MICC|nr:S26 family signal peptidase [Nesterenkonia salmonea]TLP92110.1 S26 family signal peptidase [Nesterenkonia salmonea]
MLRTIVGRFAAVGVYLLAGLGVLSLVLLGLGIWLSMGLVMFRTGSMEPAIPAGSVALVQPVDPEQIAVGDVLTVGTEEMDISVTHRVIAVNDPEDIVWAADDEGLDPSAVENGHVAVIRMQGDANEIEDPTPYAVADGEAEAVLGHVPGLAQPLQWLAQREVQLLFAAALAAGIAWAFWPRQDPVAARDRQEKREEAEHAPRHHRR